MVFMLRLIPGVLLFLLYAVETAEVRKPLLEQRDQQVHAAEQNITNGSKTNENYASKPDKEIKKITDEDVENVVKPYHFAKTNSQNSTSIKLRKSESYGTTQKSVQENSRTSNGRSVDIDIQKYASPDSNNAVYTLPISSHTKQYSSEEEIHPQYSTEEGSFENTGHLTTPQTPYFDQKYKETVDSVNQKLEFDSPDADFENLTHSSNYSTDNFIHELDENPDGTKLEYKSFETVELNRTKKPHGLHKEGTQESKTILNFETSHNKTTFYDERIPSEDSNELHKENVKYLLGDENANEVKKLENSFQTPVTAKTNVHITTKKYSITKPPTDRSDNGIISNKIESETLKSLPVTTPLSNISESDIRPNKTVNIKRGSIKFADYQKYGAPTVSTTRRNLTLEQVVQENQIVPVQVTPPTIPSDTTTAENITYPDILSEKNETTSTIRNEIVSSGPNLTDAQEQQSTTVLIIVQPDDSRPRMTTESIISDGTTVTSIPRGFRIATTTESISLTTEMDETTTDHPTEQTTNEESTNLTDENLVQTTTLGDLTTISSDVSTTEYGTEKLVDTEPSNSTQIANEGIETTTFPLDTTTTILDQQTTIGVEGTTKLNSEQTTLEYRSSKDIKFSEAPLTSTEPIRDSTTKQPEPLETTFISTEETFTTNKSDEMTTETIPIESTTVADMSRSTNTHSRDTTSELPTRIIIESTPTKTLLENHTEEAQAKPTTDISFVHIKNIDKNHTTLLPDVLKPNEIYTTAFETATKTTTDATTTDDTTHSSELDGPTSNNGAIVAIIISCVGGICLIVLACLLIVMRNRQQRFNYGQRCRPVSLDDYSVDNVSVFNSVRRKAAARDSKRSYGNPAFEDPVCLSHPLNFPAISKFAANEEDVNAEFNDVPQIIARTSELPEGCETKNRYANVIPLPESRVFLSRVEGYPNSDYINANYVTGPKNTRKYYIACQAPMSNTVDDFWRMIWEQQCKVILMVTHLFENGVEKCFDYLPPSEVLDCHRLFGDFQVTLKKREVKEKYIISSIQLKNMVSNSWREVTHFWYMGWPEKGVPAEANSLIAFLIEARSFMKSATIDNKKTAVNGNMNGTSTTEVNPVVVHCSPGTGRTGVVITCDIAIREFEQTRQVDIPKILYKIRRDRASAVQTKEQYAFIYKVIDFYATKLAGGSLESI